ncbi:hypothetical protein BN2475_480059 [Paraburkholderia ribeironis]|uniref:Uncharacterized protein n=1 Tax=Paraburkholderia ribeironis TaxID=1247936 RepID=A0A1N7SBE6_9BURK|nr:hypothetical protein BN2475_480059 [Paraburkholderia ribeironis]
MIVKLSIVNQWTIDLYCRAVPVCTNLVEVRERHIRQTEGDRQVERTVIRVEEWKQNSIAGGTSQSRTWSTRQPNSNGR